MSGTAAHPALEPTLFRRVLGHVPTAVSVIATMTGDGPAGMTVGSFTSISLDPPLIGFFAASTSQTLSAILQAGRFSVSVLADTQSDLSRAFSSRGGSRFDAAAWHLSEGGLPQFAGATAWIGCSVRSAADAGDHTAVVGAVASLEVARQGSRPLIFFRGAYCHLDKRSVPRRGDWQLDHYAEW